MSDPNPEKLPSTFKEFVAKYPELGKAHEDIARAVDSYGPLDRKTSELIKIGLSVGAGLETATKSHVRRALQHGATEQEIEQAIRLQYRRLAAHRGRLDVGPRPDRQGSVRPHKSPDLRLEIRTAPPRANGFYQDINRNRK